MTMFPRLTPRQQACWDALVRLTEGGKRVFVGVLRVPGIDTIKITSVLRGLAKRGLVGFEALAGSGAGGRRVWLVRALAPAERNPEVPSPAGLPDVAVSDVDDDSLPSRIGDGGEIEAEGEGESRRRWLRRQMAAFDRRWAEVVPPGIDHATAYQARAR